MPRVTSNWQICCCQASPPVAKCDQMSFHVTRHKFLDKGATLRYFVTISCILWPGVPGVTKCCQLWPGVIKSDQKKAPVTRKWLSTTTMKNQDHFVQQAKCVDLFFWPLRSFFLQFVTSMHKERPAIGRYIVASCDYMWPDDNWCDQTQIFGQKCNFKAFCHYILHFVTRSCQEWPEIGRYSVARCDYILPAVTRCY